MRPQIPVLAVLAVLAIPPSLALGQDDASPNVPASATTTGATEPTAPPTATEPTTTGAAPATDPTTTAETPAPPAAVPPASTATQPATPAPAPGLGAAPMPTFDPDLTDPDGPSLSTARPEHRETAKHRRARERQERREARERRAAKDHGSSKGKGDEDADDAAKDADARTPADILGAPATGLSALSVAQFRIPPFLLPIYQAAGMQYGIRWEILAAINEIETDYGRNLNVSSAGAQGWMQFMPATWATYGVDANGDGEQDPYNPVDAIFASARYLKAAGGATDVRRAVFAYNHADWYVEDVLKRARAIAALPADVVSSLTGLTLAQLPVYVPADDAPADDAPADDAPADDAPADDAPADDDRRGDASSADTEPADTDPDRAGSADTEPGDAVVVRKGGAPTWARVSAPKDSAVVAVQDGTVTRVGTSDRLGRFVELRDAYGNRYTYAGLGTLAEQHLVPRKRDDDGHAHDHEDGTGEEASPTTDAHDGADADSGAPDVAAGTPGADTTAPAATDPAPTAPATAG